ncbi:diguanylate cyclase domain-containing protein [Fusibacter tunisiensis]|uniref:Diguanylate cyclase (GGDEF)-like protein n=1 Tax=Fusibacter tunisiensis TaxID=1008308 RepID=A0ABS2MN54_9FIRM|nr:diguanylate cyclase [Fusibacter tunisiensis]MBM7560826.1 diguanylate cyclase (GGDEF)-like protein [Fusibacter tunisiensis]
MMQTDILEKLNEVDKMPNRTMALYETYEHKESFQSIDDSVKGLLYGRALVINGRHRAAASVIERALKFFQQMNLSIYAFHCLVNISIATRELKSYEASLQIAHDAYELSQSIGKDNYTVRALTILSAAYSVLDQSEKAITLLNEAASYLPNLETGRLHGDIYNNIAHELMKQERYDEALAHLHEAYKVYSTVYKDESFLNESIALFNIGNIYYKKADYERAFETLTRALEIAQTNPVLVIKRECHRLMVQVCEKLKRYKEAFEHFREFDLIEQDIIEDNKREAYESVKVQFEEKLKRNEERIDVLRNVELKSKTIELERTLKNVSMIAKIGQKLTSSMDMDEIYGHLRKSIYSLMSVNVFGLALYDAPREKIIYKYFEENGKQLPLMEIDLHDGKSLASYCILNSEDLYIRDFDRERNAYIPKDDCVGIGDMDDGETTHCIIYCRLITEEGCVGLITLQSYNAYEYDVKDFEVVKTLAGYVAIAISNAQKRNILLEKTRELEHFSYRDGLTDVYNRRFFNEKIEAWHQNKLSDLGILIADMNHLKQINDQYGHIVGDMYLIEVCTILKRCAGTDLVFRLGGDEFAVLVENATEEGLAVLSKKIHEACDRFTFEYVPLSVALGYAVHTKDMPDFTRTFAGAESKMYLEKKRYHYLR